MRPHLLFLTLSLAACCSAELPDLASEQPEERRKALACLAEDAEEDPELRPRLVRAALALGDSTREPDPSVRGTALRVLEHLAARDGVALVLSTLAAESDPGVRRAGISLLAKLGEPEQAVGPLRRLLRDDPSATVRLACARELLRVEDRSADTTDALIASLEDSAPSVRANARRTLVGLHDTDQGDSPAGWRRWRDRREGKPAEAAAEAGQTEGPPDPAELVDGPPDPAELLGEDAPAPPEERARPPRPEDFSFPEEDPFAEPQSGEPQDDGPQSDPPQSDPPQDDPPQSDPPQDNPPQSDSPQSDSPENDAPKDDAPKDDAPEDDAPEDDAPQSDPSPQGPQPPEPSR